MNNRLVTSFLIAFYCIMMPCSAKALLQSLPVNEPGDLQATVFITDSPNFLYGWMNSPPSHALNISTVAETEFNQPVSAGFAITGFTRGADLKVNLVVDFHIFAPDGSVLFQEENWAVYTKEVSTDRGIIIPAPLLDIRPVANDPPGNYKIAATVTDQIAEKKTTGSVIFKVRPGDAQPLPKEVRRPVAAEEVLEYASIEVGSNIRAGASREADVLYAAPPGYPLAIIEKDADWLLVVDFWGRKGWVFAPLVIAPETVIIRVFKGNLRSGPNLQGDIITQLPHGTIMTVLERNGEWLKVNVSDELTGWLHHSVVWP